MYIAPGRGRQPTEDKNFMTTERHFLFAHMLQVSKWSLRNLILYTRFHYFIHVYSPEARADKPLGSKFWCQQKAITTSTICCKNISLNSDFIHIFSCFFHVYNPGAGADNPLWTKFWRQQKGLITLPICCRFQKISLKSDFIYFCLFLYMYIAPGQVQTTPWGQNFDFNIKLLSLWSFAVTFVH